MKTTEFLGLNVPELADSPPDITKFSENYPKIDANAKLVSSQINNLSAYALASGTNTYTATIAGITALTEGFSIKIKFTNTNTGASTLNINGLGAKSILKGNGNALSSGNIKAGQICNLVYNGLNFQLLGEGGEYGTATASDVLSGKTVGTDNGVAEGTMQNRGAVSQNLTIEGAEYTIPAGYHNGLGKIKAVITGLVASVIKAGTTVGGIAGNFTSDATATASQMLSGAIAYVKGNKITGTIPSKGAATITPGATNQTIAAGQYLSGNQTIEGNANLLSENIKDGVNLFGKIGNYKGKNLIERYITGSAYQGSGNAEILTVDMNAHPDILATFNIGAASATSTNYYLTANDIQLDNAYGNRYGTDEIGLYRFIKTINGIEVYYKDSNWTNSNWILEKTLQLSSTLTFRTTYYGRGKAITFDTL